MTGESSAEYYRTSPDVGNEGHLQEGRDVEEPKAESQGYLEHLCEGKGSPEGQGAKYCSEKAAQAHRNNY